MAFNLQLTRKARKNLDNLPVEYRARVVATLDDIVRDPFAGKKLSGKMDGQYSTRVWPYRIIYKIYKKELLILVINVEHRGHHVY